MAFREVDAFDAPIPGQSLTHELSDRPWQNPPEYNTIEEALDFYIPRITKPDMAARLLDTIETKIPLTSIADTLTLGGVLQGLHTIDVAVLLNPIIVELMEGMAVNAEVPYVLGDEESESELPDEQLLAKAIKGAEQVDIEKIEEEMKAIKEDKKPSGLMSRRENTDGV